MTEKNVTFSDDTKSFDGNPRHPTRYDETPTYVKERHPNVLIKMIPTDEELTDMN